MQSSRTLCAILLGLLLLVATLLLSPPTSAQTPHGTLRVIHNAPTAPPMHVAVEGQTLISNHTYDQHSQDVQVAAPGYGFYRIDIVPVGVLRDGATSGIPSVASIDLSFAPGQIQTIQLIEAAQGLQLEFVTTHQALLPQAGAETRVTSLLLVIVSAACATGLLLRRHASV